MKFGCEFQSIFFGSQKYSEASKSIDTTAKVCQARLYDTLHHKVLGDLCAETIITGGQL